MGEEKARILFENANIKTAPKLLQK